MSFRHDVEWLCGMAGEIYKDVSKPKFNAGDVRMMHGHLHNIEQQVELLRKKVREAAAKVSRAEWMYFITTLPVVNIAANDAIDVPKTIMLEDCVWEWDEDAAVLGIPYSTYYHEDDFLYLFRDGENFHYYLESEYDEPEILSRKQMGYGDNTEYRRMDDGTVEVTGSGTVNMYQMIMDHGKIVDPGLYSNPIIDINHRGKKQQ